MTKLLMGADREAIWVLHSWGFEGEKYWGKEDVRAFLEAIPTEMLMITDLWADAHPFYKKMDFFFGKYWSFGVLHSFGGNTNLHGDLSDIVQQVKEASNADNCIGFALAMEIIHHNYLYYDLVTKLSWNPEGVELDEFLNDYAVRRYGTKSADTMANCLRELIKSVYGTNDLTSPLYDFRLVGESLDHIVHLLPTVRLEKRKWFVLSLRRAMGIALKEASRQKDNPLYKHDVIDITRQYLAELFNYRIVRLHNAFKSGDRQEFETQATYIIQIMDSLEKILSTDPYYSMEPLIEKARRLRGVPKNVEARVKEIYTVWDRTGASEWLLDYTRKDFYETVKFYYRKRIEAFIATLREKLQNGSTEVDLEDLIHLYRHIEYSFIDIPLAARKTVKYKGGSLSAAREILAEQWLSPEKLEDLGDEEKAAEKLVPGKVNFDWDKETLI
jgi:alpha-N-acetylglucosaminidase